MAIRARIWQSALGVDGGGKVTAVWAQDAASTGFEIMTARRLPDAGWTKPRRLAHVPFEAEFERLDFAQNAAGAAVVAWEDDIGYIRAAYRSPSGRWSNPRVLGVGESPVAAMGDAIATVAFIKNQTNGSDLVLRWHDGQRWRRAPGPPGAAQQASVAMDSGVGDDAVLMWKTGRVGNRISSYMTARFDGRWKGIRRLTDPLEAGWDENVVAGSDGSAVFTWTSGPWSGRAPGRCEALRSLYQKDVAQPPSTDQTIASGESAACWAGSSVTGSPDREAILAWFAGRGAVTVASQRPGEEEWSSPEVIGEEDEGLVGWQSPVAAIGGDGTALVAWILRSGHYPNRDPDWGLWVSRRAALP